MPENTPRHTPRPTPRVPVAPVSLRPLDESTLPALLAAAVAGADPLEVMPPVPGPGGWTAERRAAFLRFHRSRALAPEPVEATYLVLAGDEVAGAARLEPLAADGVVEAGMWLARRHRGRGVGTAVLGLLLECARAGGATRVVASTTAGNTAMRRVLAAHGARLTEGPSGEVTGRLPVGESPSGVGCAPPG
jgi:RimJ/RimL family protein N-acetyltransferase